MNNSNMYITLPSNTKSAVGLDNKPHSFRIKLPYPISLQGQWEVALVDIQYPKSWKNVSGRMPIEFMHTVVLSSAKSVPVWVKGVIPDGNYDSVSALVAGIKQGIRDAAREIPVLEAAVELKMYQMTKLRSLDVKQRHIQAIMQAYKGGTEAFWRDGHVLMGLTNKFFTGEIAETNEEKYWKWRECKRVYDSNQQNVLTMSESEQEQQLSYTFISHTNQLKLDLSGETIKAIRLPENVQYMLGLEKPLLEKGSTIAHWSSDLTGGLTSLYVHCDIVDRQIVGDVRSELLRTVPVDTRQKFGDTVHKLFTSPHYINVLHKNFDHIQIEIRTDKGQLVPFEFGNVIVKLHFRKSKGFA